MQVQRTQLTTFLFKYSRDSNTRKYNVFQYQYNTTQLQVAHETWKRQQLIQQEVSMLRTIPAQQATQNTHPATLTLTARNNQQQQCTNWFFRHTAPRAAYHPVNIQTSNLMCTKQQLVTSHDITARYVTVVNGNHAQRVLEGHRLQLERNKTHPHALWTLQQRQKYSMDIISSAVKARFVFKSQVELNSVKMQIVYIHVCYQLGKTLLFKALPCSTRFKNELYCELLRILIRHK